MKNSLFVVEAQGTFYAGKESTVTQIVQTQDINNAVILEQDAAEALASDHNPTNLADGWRAVDLTKKPVLVVVKATETDIEFVLNNKQEKTGGVRPFKTTPDIAKAELFFDAQEANRVAMEGFKIDKIHYEVMDLKRASELEEELGENGYVVIIEAEYADDKDLYFTGKDDKSKNLFDSSWTSATQVIKRDGLVIAQQERIKKPSANVIVLPYEKLMEMLARKKNVKEAPKTDYNVSDRQLQIFHEAEKMVNDYIPREVSVFIYRHFAEKVKNMLVQQGINFRVEQGNVLKEKLFVSIPREYTDQMMFDLGQLIGLYQK